MKSAFYLFECDAIVKIENIFCGYKNAENTNSVECNPAEMAGDKIWKETFEGKLTELSGRNAIDPCIYISIMSTLGI